MEALTSPRVRLLALILVVLAGFAAARATGLWDVLRDQEARIAASEAFREAARHWWAGPLFALVYAAASAVALPASPLTLLAGAAFGLELGVLWVTLGANLGASLCFWLVRRLGRGSLEQVLGARLARADRLAEAAGFHGLLALRLIPIIPFNALNVAAGLTPIAWRSYALATAIGILPATIVYVFLADAALAGIGHADRPAMLRLLLAIGLVGAFSLLSRWLVHMRRSSSRSSSPP